MALRLDTPMPIMARVMIANANSYSAPAWRGAGYYDCGHGLLRTEEWTNARHQAPSARAARGIYRDEPCGR